ncbi:M24 family metallopeptidase [Saccharopolyspora sp. ASAGF58]|uniref:M24 family metallopeptidase n=1 Tax=Saccharopolyspora sp. ASAGF58 TaxID=2719023 RepID=UPI00144684C6|nr:M24 family metallopeptidase [Saccharopolyspora sp. ASAGF58]
MSGSFRERDRRWNLLHTAMAEEGYDVLVIAGSDYRGHKGTLRYVADYNLAHRYGYSVIFAGHEPMMVLPQNLAGGRRPKTGWVSDYRFPHELAVGLVEALKSRQQNRRIGIVGLGEIMKVQEYLHIVRELPQAEVSDATAMFERVRAVKSEAELRGAEESAYITDRCFERLLEIARPGITERAVAAEMYSTAAALGGEDPLFLTMYADEEPGGPCPTFGAPRDRELRAHDVFTFSYELVGPAGYWVELSRMVTFAPPSEPVRRIAGAVSAGMAAAAQAIGPQVSTADVQKRVIEAVEAEGVKSSYWSGHGLGLDVLEEPWVGLDVVQDDSSAGAVPVLNPGMVLALHPMLWDAGTAAMGYMADTHIVTDTGCRALSQFPVQLYRLAAGG